MTTTFTASNGLTFTFPEDGSVRWEQGHPPKLVTEALREYFTAERDQELGRWRSKEHPNYVVYPVAEWPDAIDIMDESTATSHRCTPGCFHLGVETFKWGAVKAEHFAAHPARQPWYDAKPGEVWVLETELHPEPRAFKVSAREGYATSNFTQVYNGQPLYTFRDGPITAGHRIWPEGDDDEC